MPNALLLRYPKAFYLRVKGESMNRVLPNGSYALVCPTSEVVDGSVYAVSVGSSNATVKRVRKLNNGIALEPDSNDPTYKSQVFVTRMGNVKPCLLLQSRVVLRALQTMRFSPLKFFQKRGCA